MFVRVKEHFWSVRRSQEDGRGGKTNVLHNNIISRYAVRSNEKQFVLRNFIDVTNFPTPDEGQCALKVCMGEYHGDCWL